jgi:hypothetical protein
MFYICSRCRLTPEAAKMTETIPIPAPTPAQVDYARKISQRLNATIPWENIQDRRALSNWIGAHQDAFRRAVYAKGPGATSKQVAFAEQIARRRRTSVPDECFRDAGLMSRWIDHNR